MLKGPLLMKSFGISPGDNAQIEISRNEHGAIKICIRDGKHPEGYAAAVSPENAIQIALVLMEKAGIPINAELARRMQKGGPLGGVS